MINQLSDLLKYAKLKFQIAPNDLPQTLNQPIHSPTNNSQGFATDNTNSFQCDSFLSYIDLLKPLLLMGSLPPKFMLRDFSNPQKARQLRDKLMKEDRMNLAIVTSTKCHIETERIWLDWGLQLLRMGKYSEAKEKFSYCFGINYFSALMFLFKLSFGRWLFILLLQTWI